jgi:hypothetical protein
VVRFIKAIINFRVQREKLSSWKTQGGLCYMTLVIWFKPEHKQTRCTLSQRLLKYVQKAINSFGLPAIPIVFSSTNNHRIRQFKITQFQIKFSKRTEKYIIFENHTEFLFAGMEAQWDKCGWRTLLGDNTGGGEVILWPIRFQCAGGWISTGPPRTYIYSWPHVNSIPNSAKLRLTPDLPER